MSSGLAGTEEPPAGPTGKADADNRTREATTIENLDQMLQQAFDESTKVYQERGFQRRIGFGKKPAIISVDLANAWARLGNPPSCDMDKMDNEIVPGMQRLLEAVHANGLSSSTSDGLSEHQPR